VARNLREFSAHVAVAGTVGADAAGERLLGDLTQRGINVAHVRRDGDSVTIVKTRIIARHQQVVRVDREQPRTAAASIAGIEAVDAVVVADYAKGVITQSVADALGELASKDDAVLAIDPSPKNPIQWRNATVIKPNREEAFQALGAHENASTEAVGGQLLERWHTRLLLLTLGEEGMMLFERDKPPYHTPTRAREVFDVSGAGDTAIAAMTAALAGGATPIEAAEIANGASGIVVGKLGTAAVTLDELAGSFEGSR
jgi:D-beta-D-heptose 7-phosphate kinase/D-beta-D-heptose 1-phosphate adenosyltransferase